jgi:hypothetical protein
MDFKFLKDRYDYELQRKEQLTSALTLPVGVLSGLGGLMAAMVRSFSPKRLWISVPFGIALTSAVLAFFACLVYLALAYHRQKYIYLPLLGELKEFEDRFIDFSRVMAGGLEEVEEVFETNLRTRIIESADRNTDNNDERSRLLHRARLALFLVLICTAAAGVAYVLNYVVG